LATERTHSPRPDAGFQKLKIVIAQGLHVSDRHDSFKKLLLQASMLAGVEIAGGG
jgi:hypothetical protein